MTMPQQVQTKAIILAAGRGSRLGGLTEEKPKCLVPLGGHPLLAYQLAALRGAGISDIVIVGGYRAQLLEGYGARVVVNRRWADTNMVASLLCAEPFVDGPVVVSYSDIVYPSAVVEALMRTDAALAITYDRQWLELWSRRFPGPKADAETFRVAADGRVLEIGGAIDQLTDVMGQYMGLLRFTPASIGWLRQEVAAAGERGDRLDMTSTLSRLVNRGRAVVGVPIAGGWCEIDSGHDLEVATALLAAGSLGRLGSDGGPIERRETQAW
jgi:L-glutamine-phosphate cytidylyltransferase